MKNFKKYFKQLYLGILTNLKGLFLTIKYFFKKKVTLSYPEIKEDIPLSFRGIHKYNKNKCIACLICKNNCPVSCIDIESEGKGKDLKIKGYKIDYSKCLFCSMCEENCPKKAIYLSNEYNLCVDKRCDLIVDFVKETSNCDNSKKEN